VPATRAADTGNALFVPQGTEHQVIRTASVGGTVIQSDKKKETLAAGEAAQKPLLGLQVPQQSPPKADNILLDPKETEAWFEALPMANVGETARQVFNTLVEFNRIELPDLLRAKTVEKFRAPVAYITENLLKYYVEVGLPFSSKGWKTASLARELQKELAISYKLIAERMISGDSANFDRRLLVIALHRALYYLGQCLMQNALVYSAWPEGTWREINSIYAYASQNNVHQIKVKPDDGRPKRASSSIEELFKSLMLFASATPHRLRQGHVRLLFSHLADWSKLTHIRTDDDGGTSLGRFNVDLWADSPPMHNALRTPLPGKRMAILDVRDLLKQLRSDFEQAPWDSRAEMQSGKAEVTRPLLRLLIMAWSRPPERRFVRTRLNFDLNVVAGLHAIHANQLADEDKRYETTRAALFALEEQNGSKPANAPKVQWTPGSLENVSLAPLDSDFVNDSLFNDSFLLGNHSVQLPSTPNDLIDDPQAPEQDKADRHAVQTINESAGGYCIRWQGEGIPRVKIGELIGVESPSDRRSYGLGVIRWIKQLGDHRLDLGLEVISTRCEAAEISEPEEVPSPKRSAYKCLVINDTDPSSNATASLLMNTLNLQTGVDLQLAIGDQNQVIRLTKLVEFSSAFARYHFEFVKTDDEETGDETRPGDEFDDLWNNL
jgi:hypothetical protein